MRTHPSVFPLNPQPPVTLAIRSAFLLVCWLFWVFFLRNFDDSCVSVPSRLAECCFRGRFPHSSQNWEFLAPGTAGDKLSMAAGELSPGHVTSDPVDLDSANPAGLSTGRGSLQYQGNEYTILDESICLVRSSPMDFSLGGPPPQTPWSSGMDGGPLSSRTGPHHPPPPLLVLIRPQGDFGYQARPADTRRDYGPPVPQPS